MVRAVGFEPTSPFRRRLLRPLRLPFRHARISLSFRCLAFAKTPSAHHVEVLNIVHLRTERFELPRTCVQTAFSHRCLPIPTYPHMVGAEGFEPPMFTQRGRVYSPPQHRRRCRTPIWCRVWVTIPAGLRQGLYRPSRLLNGLPRHSNGPPKPDSNEQLRCRRHLTN